MLLNIFFLTTLVRVSGGTRVSLQVDVSSQAQIQKDIGSLRALLHDEFQKSITHAEDINELSTTGGRGKLPLWKMIEGFHNCNNGKAQVFMDSQVQGTVGSSCVSRCRSDFPEKSETKTNISIHIANEHEDPDVIVFIFSEIRRYPGEGSTPPYTLLQAGDPYSQKYNAEILHSQEHNSNASGNISKLLNALLLSEKNSDLGLFVRGLPSHLKLTTLATLPQQIPEASLGEQSCGVPLPRSVCHLGRDAIHKLIAPFKVPPLHSKEMGSKMLANVGWEDPGAVKSLLYIKYKCSKGNPASIEKVSFMFKT